jgi:hypothetical protein
VHTLVGGGGLHEGFDALDYRKIKRWDAGKVGNYPILSVLPDKFARFMYEFHDYRFTSLDLPPLPADIEAILMCMEPSILIRFGSSCISVLAFKLLSLLSL